MEKKIRILVDTKKVSPEKLDKMLNELSEIAIVENGVVIYDDDNKEQENKIKDLFDKFLIDNVLNSSKAYAFVACILGAIVAVLAPWFLVWPVFLSLPIGLLEIWLMERIRRGAKPFWRVMKFASALVFFLPIYLIGFTFWIR